MFKFINILMMVAVTLSTSTWAQLAQPRESVPIVSTGGPGGMASNLIFGLQSQMSKIVGTNTPIDHKPGSNGVVAINHVLNHGKDRSMLMVLPWHISINQFFRSDLKPIAFLGESSLVMVMKPDSKILNFTDLLNQRKKLTIGQAPVTPVDTLVKEMKKNYPSHDIISLTYRSGAEAVTALLGGHIDVAVISAAGALAHITAGNLMAIANIAGDRSPLLPNVTTLNEQGINWKFEQYMGLAWFIVASPGTDNALIQQIRNELGAWMQTAEGKLFLTKNDLPLRNKNFATPDLVLQKINNQ